MRPKFVPGRNRAGPVIASHPPSVQIVQVAECVAGNVEPLTPLILPLQVAAEPPLILPTAFPSTADAQVMPIQIACEDRENRRTATDPFLCWGSNVFTNNNVQEASFVKTTFPEESCRNCADPAPSDFIDYTQAPQPPIADALFSEELLAMACGQRPTSSFTPFPRVQGPLIEMRSFSGEPLPASTVSVPMFFGADDDSREIFFDAECPEDSLATSCDEPCASVVPFAEEPPVPACQALLPYVPLPSRADLHFATVAAGPIYFDAHAHLDLFNSALHGRRKKMKFASVAQLDQMFKRIPPNFGGLFWNLVMPSYIVPRWRWVLDLLKDRKVIGTTVGIHPRSADQLDRKYDMGQHVVTMRQFIQMLLNDKKRYKVCAIGECGLDTKPAPTTVPLDKQMEVFIWHLQLAKEHGLPVVLHCRTLENNEDLMIRTITTYLGGAYPVYLHCAPRKPRMIKAWMEKISGCLFGIGPCFLEDTLEARDVIKMIPLSRMLVETDAPFFQALTGSVYELTDAGRRQLSGTATHPAACALLNEYVAKIKGLTYAQVAYATRTATLRFYNLDADYQHLIEEQRYL
ncbi:unnamed protein product, partial [Mesorhabditis spiculigera]